jgi:hypothetical protein
MSERNSEFESGKSNGELSDDHKAFLDFETKTYKHQGAKEQDIMENFGIPAHRYYQKINALIDNPAAHEYNPQLMKRLWNQREIRKSKRSPNYKPDIR